MRLILARINNRTQLIRLSRLGFSNTYWIASCLNISNRHFPVAYIGPQFSIKFFIIIIFK
jgi:hypothetical protein